MFSTARHLKKVQRWLLLTSTKRAKVYTRVPRTNHPRSNTTWALFQRNSREDADRYLSDRAGKGCWILILEDAAAHLPAVGPPPASARYSTAAVNPASHASMSVAGTSSVRRVSVAVG
jgi:hypothetical protein